MKELALVNVFWVRFAITKPFPQNEKRMKEKDYPLICTRGKRSSATH